MKKIELNNLGPIGDLMIYFSIAALIVLGLVIYFTVYFAWKYQHTKQPVIPKQNHGSSRFEYGIISIALGLVTIFFILTVWGMNKIQDIPNNPKPDVVITGHQWWWEAKYTESGLVTANEIHLPVGKKLILQFNAQDVIHSWWVPRLGRKMDLVPGYDNYLSVLIKEPGDYWGSCSEFCGEQHGWMRIRVIAETRKEFDLWEEKQLALSNNSNDHLFQQGRQLFLIKTCQTCHSISQTADEPNEGPNLANFSTRSSFLSNMKKNNKANLTAWLQNPQNVKSGAKMPNMVLSDIEIKTLVYFLQHRK